MSKELVISANRHETRVAIIEDDQVVEVYHQRENEYSLAGSIHKGRVTRVLPGMQSAFVDIGLDRDAFLYVSDFFEDNEEYDKIVTSVEEKVLKLDRSPQAAAPAAVALPVPPVVSEAAIVEEAPAETASPSGAAAGPPPAPEQRRDDRDRKGRRGRRRRGQKGGGRGLPDSKFYSPAGRSTPEVDAAPMPAPQPQPDTTPSSLTADDFFVLPGESLAKYTRGDYGEREEGADESDAAPDREPLALESAEQAAAEQTAVFQDAGAQARIPAGIDEVPGAVEAVPGPQDEFAEDVDLTETDPGEPVELSALQSTPEEEDGTPELAEVPENAEPDAEPSTMNSEPEGAEAEGPDPARVPTSLTATLREQGPRYLHRVSRRMRRKGRGPLPEGGRAPQQDGRAQDSGVRAPIEQRTAPAPASGRLERADKGVAPSISDLLKEGQEIIVQIAKEPLGQKGARITSHIALPGRFLVYMPTVDHIGVSRKIPSDDERSRLKRVLQTHRAGIPGGFIVRTAGEGHTEEELRADMMFLYNLWLDLRQKAERKPAPLLIHHDLNVVERVLRDQLTSAFKNIWVDNEEVYESALRFVQRFQPALVSRVKMYTRVNPIFDEFGITSELEKALRPKVWLKSGGYIVINQTEALVAIDVNTGKFVGKSNRLEDTIVKTNTDAIKEIVRQIRLRDLGGIIVVDFIDMDERKNRQKVMQTLEEAMRSDRAPYKILQFNDFGLVAITRKRVKQSLERTLCTSCPYCEGAGYVKSPQTVVAEILQEAHKIAKAVDTKEVMLRVAPDVAKLLKSHQNTYLQELEEILGRTVIVKSDPQLHQEKFDMA